MKNIDILNCLEEWCPKSTAASYDNVGLLVGDQNQEITKILVALDCTSRVIEEAKNLGANLIVTHHPIIWAPLKNITEQKIGIYLNENIPFITKKEKTI